MSEQPKTVLRQVDHQVFLTTMRRQLRDLQETAKAHPSRELSLVITKIQEAYHWLLEVPVA